MVCYTFFLKQKRYRAAKTKLNHPVYVFNKMEDKSKKSKRSRRNSFGKDEELLFVSEIENFYYRFTIFFLQPSKKRDIYASLSSRKVCHF
jgi:hypothetical protein